MIDRERVIEHLTWATEEKDVWDALYGNDLEGVIDTMKDAIALLKAQEPKLPIIKENSYGRKFYYCPSCGKEFYQYNKFNFCEKCGQAVKWE